MTDVSFVYDVYGNVVSRTENSATTKFAWEINNNSAGTTKSVHSLWAELNTGGTVTTRYLEANGEVVAGSSMLSEIACGGFGNIENETDNTKSGNVLYTGII